MRRYASALTVAVLGTAPFCAHARQSGYSLLLTVDARNPAVELKPADLAVKAGDASATVTGLRHFSGDEGGIALAILMDDNTELSGRQRPAMDDIRNFILALPAQITVGVGYLRYGGVEMAQPITADHAAAAAALRLPVASSGQKQTKGLSPNPYASVVEAIQKWPAGPEQRREIVMFSDGVFAHGQQGSDAVTKAVSAAQRAGIPVFGIHIGAFEKGGVFNNLTGHSGGDLCAWLNEVAQRLNHQYLLTFTPAAGTAPGPVKVKGSTTVPGVRLMAADQAFPR